MRPTFLQRCQIVSESLAFQLVAILALLARVIWGMWEWRDLTGGDTSSYYTTAFRDIAGTHAMSLVFSPLYVKFYGWFGLLFEDAYVATTLHRIVILVLLAVSILLLARALLPKSIAWLVAAWWLVLPINWNALYEVHLFGFLWIVLGCWALSGRWRLLSCGMGLAFLWCGALLVRNEYALTVALVTAACVVREFLAWRASNSPLFRLFANILALATPSLLMTAAAVLIWWHSWVANAPLSYLFNDRHTLNMAQVYPFSYQQRHPEWTKNPWIDGGELMKQTFGAERVTFSEACKRNPKAMWEHLLWHARLLPAGLQMGVFNCHSGPLSPDFTPPRQMDFRANLLSCGVIVLMVMGGICLWRDRAEYMRLACSTRGWSWLGLLCTIPPSVVAIITQRPRPSYIFPLSFFVMALCGLCLYAVLRRYNGWHRFKTFFPVLVPIVLLAAEPERTTAQQYTGRPLLEIYRRIWPYRNYLKGPEAVFACRDYPDPVGYYLRQEDFGRGACTIDASSFKSAQALDDEIEKNHVTTFYLDQADLKNPAVGEWIKARVPGSWRILASGDPEAKLWMLVQRVSGVATQASDQGKVTAP